MGPGVGGADDGSGVSPHPDPGLPVGLAVAVGREREAGAQVVGHGDVAQHVERFAAQLGGHVGHRSALVGLGLGRGALGEHVLAEVGQAQLRVTGGLQQGPASLGRGQAGQPVGVGLGHGTLPPGDGVEQEPRREAEPGPHRHGDGQAQHPSAALGSTIGGPELGVDLVGHAGQHHQDVPVQRPVGRCRHASHEVALGRGEVAQARDELEGGAGMTADLVAQLQQLGLVGPARRHRLTVAVVVGGRPRRREAERPLLEALAQQGAHGRHLVVGGGALVGGRAHHGAANGRVTGQEPQVGGDLAVDAVQVGAEAGPAPVGGRLQRGQGHALHPSQHPHQVLALRRRQRCHREAAVAGDGRGHTVQGRRRQGGVPEGLDVVVGVQVDEARAHDAPVGLDGAGRTALEALGDLDHPAVGDGHIGSPPRRAGPVDHQPAADVDVVAHGYPWWGTLPAPRTRGIRRRPLPPHPATESVVRRARGPRSGALVAVIWNLVERTTGFEPATPTLARLCSTN